MIVQNMTMSAKSFPKGRPLDPGDASCPFIVYNEEFLQVLGPDPRLDLVVATDAHEGPVYVRAEDALYFTTVPRNVNVPTPGYKTVAISRLDLAADPPAVSVVREPSNMANGMTLGRDGSLIVCEQGTRSSPAAISRLDLRTRVRESLVEQWFHLPFNSPNDVVVKSDGTIWFTDPSYGFLQSFKPEPLVGDFVYRFDPARGSLAVVADGFNKPNVYLLNDTAIYAAQLQARGAVPQPAAAPLHAAGGAEPAP